MLGEHIQGDVPPIRGLRPDLPIFLERFIHRLIARDPKQRYASAIQALNELISDEDQQKLTETSLDDTSEHVTLGSQTPWLIGGFCCFLGILGWLFLF